MKDEKDVNTRKNKKEQQDVVATNKKEDAKTKKNDKETKKAKSNSV